MVEWWSTRMAPPSAYMRPKPYVDTNGILTRAFREAVAAFLRNGCFDEADHMAQRGLAALPDDRQLLALHALSAQKAGRSASAIDRWRRALRIAMDEAAYHVGLATSLREAGDYKRAQAAVDEGLRQCPEDPAIVAEAAALAGCIGQYRTALGLWRRAIATAQPNPDWLQGHVRTLIYLGAFEEAEAAWGVALVAFPEHADLQALEGLLAAARKEGSGHVQPMAEGDESQNDAVAEEQVDAVPTCDPRPEPAGPAARPTIRPLTVEPVQIEDEKTKQLLLRFESLGENCEFGLVQRRYLAEPLGLLRWTNVSLDALIAALGHRLHGMGEETNTDIAVEPGGEFFMHDRRWSLGIHTFQFDGQMNKDALYKRMCRRITYLRDKLLSDLAEAEKIFIYASTGLDGDRMEMLHKALRVFGPVKMLAVQPVTSSPIQGSGGEIVKIDEDRFAGFLGRSGRGETGAWNIAFDDWVSVCRKTAEAV